MTRITPEVRPTTPSQFIKAIDYSQLGESLTTLGIALVAVDVNNHVRYSSELANQLFNINPLLKIAGQQLHCDYPSHRDMLAEAILNTEQLGRPTSFKLGHSEQTSLAIIVQPDCQPAYFDNDQTTSFLLLIRPSATCQLRLSRKMLSQRFGITTAESEVLAMMAHGACTQDIASNRSTSNETIRSQIKALCAKTGSRGQVGLMAFATQTVAEGSFAELRSA